MISTIEQRKVTVELTLAKRLSPLIFWVQNTLFDYTLDTTKNCSPVRALPEGPVYNGILLSTQLHVLAEMGP
jgi:hypothetical protein